MDKNLTAQTGSKVRRPRLSPIFAVEIITADGPMISRFFTGRRAANRWAKWTAGTWPTRIMLGGQGGVCLATFAGPMPLRNARGAVAGQGV